MIPTIEYIEQKFREYNAAIFNSELVPLPIKLSRARTFVGITSYKRKRKLLGGERKYDFSLRFSTCFDLTESEWDDVIIHEMIHYYIGSRQIRDTSAHGAVFRKMMTDINLRFHRNITISMRKAHLASTGQTTSPVYFCVIRLRDGRTGVISVAKTRIFEIHRRIAMLVSAESIKWYVSRDEYFARFRRRRSLRTISIAPAEELQRHLANCRPLVFEN